MAGTNVIAWKPLGELLVERGFLDAETLTEALDHQSRTGGLLGAILVERGDVTAPALTSVLAEQAGVEWKPLGELLVERGVLSADELETALDRQVETGERLGEILVERRIVAGAVLAAILAEQAGSKLEREAGFGSGLLARLAARDRPGADEGERPVRPVVGSAAVVSDPALTATDPQELDPAFELLRLRSELEAERARVAALQQEVAELRSARRRKPRAAAG